MNITCCMILFKDKGNKIITENKKTEQHSLFLLSNQGVRSLSVGDNQSVCLSHCIRPLGPGGSPNIIIIP